MAGKGPPPKSPDKQRNPDTVVTVVPDDEPRGPLLPPKPPPATVRKKGEETVVIEIDWPAQTLAWWENWRRSPQAQKFTTTDWDFLTDTAILHAAYWSGDASVAGELRLRVAKFGATPEDRMRLRVQIAEPDKPGAPEKKRQQRRLTVVDDAVAVS